MRLVYRGIKYSSNNLIALKIVQEHKHKINKIISNKKAKNIIINHRFPFLKYFKQLLGSDANFISNPYKYWYKYRAKYLETCWELSELEILNSCWGKTLEKEPEVKVTENDLPVKFTYRGVTYYKYLD